MLLIGFALGMFTSGLLAASARADLEAQLYDLQRTYNLNRYERAPE